MVRLLSNTTRHDLLGWSQVIASGVLLMMSSSSRQHLRRSVPVDGLIGMSAVVTVALLVVKYYTYIRCTPGDPQCATSTFSLLSLVTDPRKLVSGLMTCVYFLCHLSAIRVLSFPVHIALLMTFPLIAELLHHVPWRPFGHPLPPQQATPFESNRTFEPGWKLVAAALVLLGGVTCVVWGANRTYPNKFGVVLSLIATTVTAVHYAWFVHTPTILFPARSAEAVTHEHPAHVTSDNGTSAYHTAIQVLEMSFIPLLVCVVLVILFAVLPSPMLGVLKHLGVPSELLKSGLEGGLPTIFLIVASYLTYALGGHVLGIYSNENVSAHRTISPGCTPSSLLRCCLGCTRTENTRPHSGCWGWPW